MTFISLFFLFVLQLETSISGLLNFVGREKEALWLPLVVFGSMTIGNALSLKIRKDEWVIQSAFHILALPLIVFFASLRFFPEYYLTLSLFPFVAIGLIMTAMYAHYQLWHLVFGFFISGIVFYLVLFFASAQLTQLQFPLLLANLFLIALIQAKRPSHRLAATAVTISLSGLFYFGFFDFPSRLHQVLANYRDVRQLSEPRMSGLFRTDLLYLSHKDLLILQANGTRFAILPSIPLIEHKLSGRGGFSPSHDSPYLVTKPSKVLVIGPAEGANAISALANGVKDITTVDINPNMYNFSLQEARAYTGGFYDRPEIRRIVGEGRNFLETTTEKFDLITLQGVQTGSQMSLESYAQIESYLFTNEALKKLWDRLTDTGIIYLEEYRDFFSSSPRPANASLLTSLGNSSFQVLNIASQDQVRLISFDQASRNPNSRQNFRRRREALFISKNPISDETIQKVVTRIGSSARIENLNPNSQQAHITDDRPMFMIASLAEHHNALLISIGILIVLLATFTVRAGAQKRQTGELVLLGLIYMLFVMAVSGPASLILGHPGYVVPVLYGSLLGGSLMGAWIVLKAHRQTRYLEVFLTAFLIFFAIFQSDMKDHLIGVNSTAVRFGTVLALGFFFGMLMEIPYIRLLNQVEGWQRAFRFFVENAGTVMAVPLGLWIQAQWGFSISIYLCIILACALTALRARQLLKGGP